MAKGEEFDRNEIYWFSHPESGCCFLEYGDFVGDGLCENLGKAERMTINECRIILRSLGVPRETILKISISDEPPIPF